MKLLYNPKNPKNLKKYRMVKEEKDFISEKYDLGKLKILITGSPKSATKFMSCLLSMAGIECAHEYLFSLPMYLKCKKVNQPYLVNQPIYAAESAWEAIPYLQFIDRKKVNIIHLVRNPLKVISSYHCVGYFVYSRQSTTFIVDHLEYKNLKEYSYHIEKCAYFWLTWNLMAEKHDLKRYKIEDIDMDKKGFLGEIGIKTDNNTCIFNNEKYNSYNKENIKLELKDIRDMSLRSKFAKLAYKYGYDL